MDSGYPTPKNNKENGSYGDERRFPLSKSKEKKSSIRLYESERSSQIVARTLLGSVDGRKRYCLMCEEHIPENVVDYHEGDCEELSVLLKDRTLSTEKIVIILNAKIDRLSEEVYGDCRRLQEGL